MRNDTTMLERFIPLAEAAQRLGLSQAALRRLVKSGQVKAVTLPDGEIVVSEKDTQQAVETDRLTIVVEQLRSIRRKGFKHLHGRGISIAVAAKKYDVPGTTLRDWIDLHYINVLESGYRMKIDEGDVAYCTTVYRIRKSNDIVGAPLLDKSGRPYLLKHPKLGEYRRKKKTGSLGKISARKL